MHGGDKGSTAAKTKGLTPSSPSELWPREVIEEALGSAAEAVQPHAVMLAELRARIPRYQLTMLEHFADQRRTTVVNVPCST